MANFKKNIFKLCIFWVIINVLLIPSLVSADTTDIGYITNNTTIILSNNRGVDYTLPNMTVNSTVTNIRTIIIQYSNQNLLKDIIYELELSTPNASFGDNINHFYIRANGDTICRFYGMGDLTNGYPKIYFSCPSNFSYMTIGLSTISGNDDITSSSNFRWNYAFLRKLDSKEDMDFGPVISNQTQNTQDIINNENNNTQNIINNQNSLLGTECQNEWNSSLTTATTHRGITFTPVLKNGVVEKYVINGTRTSGSNAYVVMNTNITITKGTHIKVYSSSGIYAQLYDGTNVYNFTEYTATETKTWNSLAIFTNVSPIDNVEYKVMISQNSNAPFCLYGSYNSKLDDVSSAIGGVTDAITDDNIGSSTSDASDFITNFSTNTFGLTSIVTAPLTLIQSLTSSACTDLELPLPYLNNKKLTLPCMSTIYSTYFGTFFTMYQTITYGIIAYWVIVRIFNQVKDFKNPEHDEIEVVDL